MIFRTYGWCLAKTMIPIDESHDQKNIPDMNFDQLRIFLAVADEMSVSGAADQMGTTQPVISRTIKRLEGELHAQLFDRLPRGVTLTPFGKVLYDEAQIVLAAHQRTIERFRTLKGVGRTQVRIGAGATWLEERLPSFLASFSREHPTVQVDATFIPRSQIIEALLLGRIDIGLAQFSSEPLPADDVEYEELFLDKLCIIGRRGHPLVGKLDSSEVFGELKWAITPSASGEERLRGLGRRFDVTYPEVHIRCHSAASVLRIVRETDLVTLAPKFLAETVGYDQFEILSQNFSISLSKGILTPRRGSLSLGARLFQAHLRKKLKDGLEKKPKWKQGAQ